MVFDYRLFSMVFDHGLFSAVFDYGLFPTFFHCGRFSVFEYDLFLGEAAGAREARGWGGLRCRLTLEPNSSLLSLPAPS